MLDLLWRTAFRWKVKPHHVTGDGKYGTVENIAAVEESGIRAYTWGCTRPEGEAEASSPREPSPTTPKRISTCARLEKP
jgi:hypothetical protein